MNAAMELKNKWKDQFCSVEHLVLAIADDVRFGEAMFKQEGLTKQKLEEAIKEVGLSNCGVCEQSGVLETEKQTRT